jgi:UDP-N-acetylmuramyl tripeptide synthase
MIAGLSARLRKLEAIAVHRQTRVIVINSGPGGKERAEREIAALEAARCRDRIIRVCTGVWRLSTPDPFVDLRLE